SEFQENCLVLCVVARGAQTLCKRRERRVGGSDASLRVAYEVRPAQTKTRKLLDEGGGAEPSEIHHVLYFGSKRPRRHVRFAQSESMRALRIFSLARARGRVAQRSRARA